MNPENNNLTPNPGAPGAGLPNDPLNTASPNGLTMSDGLASAQDNLTSAGLAATTDAGVMDLNQLSSTAPEAVMTPPIDEPLVPAAPVPGSIGSVTSVPPINPDPTVAPVAPADPAATTDPTAPTTPVAEPAPAPYNPFAQTAPAPSATATSEPTAPGMVPNPAFQPAVPPKTKMKLSPLTLGLAIAAGVLLIVAIVVTILYIHAINNPKIVYVPQTPSEESNARIEMLTCSRETDFAGYAGLEYPAIGSQTMVASYTNNTLRAVSMDYAMRFADENEANLAQANFAAEQADVFNTIANSFSVNYNVDGGNLDVEILSGRDTLTDDDAATLMYGLGNANASVSLDAVRNLYESAGYTCSAE